MSLAKQIIHADDDAVANYLLRSDVELDVLDEFGYTPLIETAIVDSSAKAELLLRAGASVDFTDLTGRTALHWAADNGNFELCKLLLRYGANANACSHAGQSVLVSPFLRKQRNIVRLLFKHGANQEFAEDFINAKLLGHRYELEGRVDIVDNENTFLEVELEGFYMEFTLDIIASSLSDFRRNYAGKHLRKYFSKIDVIIKSLKVALELIKYQHYLVDKHENEKRINQLLDFHPLLLPVAYAGHAISLIKFWEMLVRCDRGEFGRAHGTVIFYEINKRLQFNKAFMRQLLYKRQDQQFIDRGMEQFLGLQAKIELPLLSQKSGNCSWANIEAAVPTLLFMLLLMEQGERQIQSCQQEAMAVYAEWAKWDRERALYFCMQSFKESDAARKAAKATLLAAILFQACDYENPEDQVKANRIIALLSQKEYRYILKSYYQVFGRDKNNPYMKNLANFLQLAGIDIENF